MGRLAFDKGKKRWVIVGKVTPKLERARRLFNENLQRVKKGQKPVKR